MMDQNFVCINCGSIDPTQGVWVVSIGGNPDVAYCRTCLDEIGLFPVEVKEGGE